MDLKNIKVNEKSSQRQINATWFHSYVEYNEQTELTRKMGTDSQRESGWQLLGVQLVERLSKKKKGLVNTVVTAEEEGSKRGLNGNEKIQ